MRKPGPSAERGKAHPGNVLIMYLIHENETWWFKKECLWLEMFPGDEQPSYSSAQQLCTVFPATPGVCRLDEHVAVHQECDS